MKRREAGGDGGARRILLTAAAVGRVMALAAAVLFMTACPPVTYHDGLMAYAPQPGEPEGRIEASHIFTNFRSPWDQDWVVLFGARFGQQVKRFAFEEGVTLMPPYFGVDAGVGLVKPHVILRAGWYPLYFGGLVPDWGYWQTTLLTGSAYNPHGFGWAAGGRASQTGVAPVALLEYGIRENSFRLEASITFKAPWASSDIRGRTFDIGVTGAVHPEYARR